MTKIGIEIGNYWSENQINTVLFGIYIAYFSNKQVYQTLVLGDFSCIDGALCVTFFMLLSNVETVYVLMKF